MQQLILVLHVLAAIALISLVLLQHGKGADVGAAFGSGAANTMFGSVGPASFLMKVTGILGAIFFATSIALSYIDARLINKSQFVAPTSAPTTLPINSMPAQPESNSFSPDKTTPADSQSKPADTSPSSAKPSHKANH